MKVKIDSEVAQSCPTVRDPMDHSLPGSSVRGIFQARVLEWGAIAFSDEPQLTSPKHTHRHTHMHARILDVHVKPLSSNLFGAGM